MIQFVGVAVVCLCSGRWSLTSPHSCHTALLSQHAEGETLNCGSADTKRKNNTCCAVSMNISLIVLIPVVLLIH